MIRLTISNGKSSQILVGESYAQDEKGVLCTINGKEHSFPGFQVSTCQKIVDMEEGKNELFDMNEGYAEAL